jgi:hypothetical protein
MDGDVLDDEELLDMQRWSHIMWERGFGNLDPDDLANWDWDWEAVRSALAARRSFESELLKRIVAERCGLGVGPQLRPLYARD